MVGLPRVRLHCATDKAQRVFSVQDGLLAHSVVVYEGRVQRWVRRELCYCSRSVCVCERERVSECVSVCLVGDDESLYFICRLS